MTSALAQLGPQWQQLRAQWQANARLRVGIWLVLALALAQLLLMALDRVDARKLELESLRRDEQRLRAVPSAQAWGERSNDAAQVLAAYASMAWAEPDLGLSEAALQDWLRTVTGRLGLPVRELTVARQQALVSGATPVKPLPPGHQVLRARLVVELQRTPLMAFLAEVARSERSIVVERMVWRGAGQPPTVELELLALARDGAAK